MANILVIDAKPRNHKVLNTLLNNNKHNLFVATNAIQVLEIICKEHCDLIIGVIDETDSIENILNHVNGLTTQQKETKSPFDAELTHLLSHELSQPLVVINAYVSGCIRRLEKNVYDKKQIIVAMKMVNHQVERIGKLILPHQS